MPEYKVICVDMPIRGGQQSAPESIIKPLLISTPAGVSATSATIKEWATILCSGGYQAREWSSGRVFFTEEDAEKNFLLTAMFNSPNWDSIKPIWFELPRNSGEALEYSKAIKKSVPEYEHLIATNARDSLLYSCQNASPFPAGEAAISECPDFSVKYAEAHGVRLKAAECKIAEDDDKAEEYGKVMSMFDLWGSWTYDEVARSPVWILQYAKEELHGPVSENLHSAMVMFSFSRNGNKWVKKYFRTKKYRPKVKA